MIHTCWQCGESVLGGTGGYLCSACDVMWLRFDLRNPPPEYDPEFAAHASHP